MGAGQVCQCLGPMSIRVLTTTSTNRVLSSGSSAKPFGPQQVSELCETWRAGMDACTTRSRTTTRSTRAASTHQQRGLQRVTSKRQPSRKPNTRYLLHQRYPHTRRSIPSLNHRPATWTPDDVEQRPWNEDRTPADRHPIPFEKTSHDNVDPKYQWQETSARRQPPGNHARRPSL